jgi:hypothetical protein
MTWAIPGLRARIDVYGCAAEGAFASPYRFDPFSPDLQLSFSGRCWQASAGFLHLVSVRQV